jgi:hypothetical protein
MGNKSKRQREGMIQNVSSPCCSCVL